MSDLLTVFEAGKTVLSLTAELAKLVEPGELPEMEDDSLSVIITKLRAEAITMSGEFANRLREMIQDFEQLNMDMSKTFDELLSNLGWMNFIAKSRLKNARDNFFNMHRQLSSFVDDVSTVLICAGTVASASSAYRRELSVKKHLDELMLSKPSIEKLLKNMIELADDLHAELRGGSPFPGGTPSPSFSPVPGGSPSQDGTSPIPAIA